MGVSTYRQHHPLRRPSQLAWWMDQPCKTSVKVTRPFSQKDCNGCTSQSWCLFTFCTRAHLDLVNHSYPDGFWFTVSPTQSQLRANFFQKKNNHTQHTHQTHFFSPRKGCILLELRAISSFTLIKKRNGAAPSAMIYETRARFIKNLKRFNTFYRGFKSGRAFKNLMQGIFHRRHLLS